MGIAKPKLQLDEFEAKKFKAHIDERGSLVPVEFKVLDFVPKRLFYVTDAPKGCRRGGHSHKETRQIALIVNWHPVFRYII